MKRFGRQSISGASLAGLLAGVVSAAGIGATSLLIHYEAANLPAAEITFSRSIIGAIVTLPFVWSQLRRLLRREMAAVWVRALAGAVSIQCFTWNLQNTSVGLANILFNASLIIILGVGYIGGETRPSGRAFIAMALIVLGSAAFWYVPGSNLSAGVMTVGLLGALAASVAYTALKKATRIANPWLINWAVCATSMPVGLISRSGAWTFPTAHSALVLCAIGFGILVSHYLLILSFARLPLALATALTPSCIVWSVVGETLTGGVGAAWQGIVGATTYAVGIGGLIVDSRRPADIAEKATHPAQKNGSDLISTDREIAGKHSDVVLAAIDAAKD